MASVSLQSVSKVFPGQVAAVKRLDLEVRDREFLVLLGPSGCGKSTTLRLIAGLEDATEGEIRIGDHVVNDVAPKDRDIAMVFQNYALYPHMSAYKNMAFGLELRYGGNSLHRIWKRLTSPTDAADLAAKRLGIRDKVRQTAQVLGIENLLDRMPRQLSGGERQRVALGRAIVRQPAVFLFDEPLSNLDAKLRLETRRELKQLHHRLETTMIYVTHDQTEAMTLGQRIVVMDQGEIRQVGTPTQVYDQPANQFVAGFMGAPPMNFVPGKLTRNGGELMFAGNGLQVSIRGNKEKKLSGDQVSDVILGIRPEDVTVRHAQGETSTARGKVILVESLGDCTLLHVEMAGETESSGVVLTSKTEPRPDIERGAVVAVGMDPQQLHLFDPASGNSLTLDSGSSNAA